VAGVWEEVEGNMLDVEKKVGWRSKSQTFLTFKFLYVQCFLFKSYVLGGTTILCT
jgi:hypothetical protein